MPTLCSIVTNLLQMFLSDQSFRAKKLRNFQVFLICLIADQKQPEHQIHLQLFSHFLLILVSFFRQCSRQPVTRSSIGSWTPPIFSCRRGLEGRALTLRQLRNSVHQPTKPPRSWPPPSTRPNVPRIAYVGLFGQHLTPLSWFWTRKQKNVWDANRQFQF